MPIPKVVGQWNKAGLNRLTRHIAPWMPGFGVVVHCGRRSGRRYQTPVNVFSAGNGYVIALTYGPETDWVKNVLAAGGCELRTRGQTIAHGFLTLSLFSSLLAGLRTGGPRSINYGLDRVRFIAPVKVGARIRGRFERSSSEEREDGTKVIWKVTIEGDAADKPCCVADWIVLYMR